MRARVDTPSKDYADQVCKMSFALLGNAPKGARQKSRTWNSWYHMIRRCYDPTHIGFKNYGARGISVCGRWLHYLAFVEDMRLRPDNTTLGRQNNDVGYGPMNCNWETDKQQHRNRRDNRHLSYKGTTKCLAEWAEQCGIHPRTLWGRLKRGWKVADALETPVDRSVNCARYRARTAPLSVPRAYELYMRAKRRWEETVKRVAEEDIRVANHSQEKDAAGVKE
jgi:hypothetical protein